MRVVSTMGKIGPSYLLSEDGDLSFLLCFSKQCLVENIQGKFQKKCIGAFNFWGITWRQIKVAEHSFQEPMPNSR